MNVNFQHISSCISMKKIKIKHFKSDWVCGKVSFMKAKC